MICKTFALPRGCKTFANHFDFQFHGKFRQIDGKIPVCNEISATQCGNAQVFVSLFFAKIMKNFRENNAVKMNYSEMGLTKCEFVI